MKTKILWGCSKKTSTEIKGRRSTKKRGIKKTAEGRKTKLYEWKKRLQLEWKHFQVQNTSEGVVDLNSQNSTRFLWLYPIQIVPFTRFETIFIDLRRKCPELTDYMNKHSSNFIKLVLCSMKTFSKDFSPLGYRNCYHWSTILFSVRTVLENSAEFHSIIFLQHTNVTLGFCPLLAVDLLIMFSWLFTSRLLCFIRKSKKNLEWI